MVNRKSPVKEHGTNNSLEMAPLPKISERRGVSEHSTTSSFSPSSAGSYEYARGHKLSPRDELLRRANESNMTTGTEICHNLAVEFKLLCHHIFDFLMIIPACWVAFYFTNMATYRHETAHQFANRAGLYTGPNDTNGHPAGTNLDHLRARDLGFEMFAENHSEAFASIIDIGPPFLGILIFTPMFLAALCRKFNKAQNEADRFAVAMLAEGTVMISIMISFRCIFFLSTSLPAPDRECVRGIRDWSDENQAADKAEGLHHNPSCGDLIYSGHFNMSYSFFMYYLTESHRFFRGESPLTKAFRYLWGMFIFSIICAQVYGILATRHHYTIDIVVLPFVDYFVRNAVLPKLGLGYDRLNNRGAMLYSHFKGFRLFGQSYMGAQKDSGHQGPSPKFRKFLVFFLCSVVGAIGVAWMMISKTLLNKLAKNCPATPDDEWCQFVHHNIQPMFLI